MFFEKLCCKQINYSSVHLSVCYREISLLYGWIFLKISGKFKVTWHQTYSVTYLDFWKNNFSGWILGKKGKKWAKNYTFWFFSTKFYFLQIFEYIHALMIIFFWLKWAKNRPKAIQSTVNFLPIFENMQVLGVFF